MCWSKGQVSRNHPTPEIQNAVFHTKGSLRVNSLTFFFLEHKVEETLICSKITGCHFRHCCVSGAKYPLLAM